MSEALDFTDVLHRAFAEAEVSRPAETPETFLASLPDELRAGVAVLADEIARAPRLVGAPVRMIIEQVNSIIDARLSRQLNGVLHHPEFQTLEASWRGLHFMVRCVDSNELLKVKLFDISQRELSRTLRKFRGAAWDNSPIFRKIYEEEYGQFGGEPFGILVGDYYFDHQPQNLQLLADIAAVAAAAHVPFITGASPSLMQMETWAELANPRDLGRIFATPEYAAWRSFREADDSRYVGLCMPRMLSRLPYGMRTDPVDDFAFEEDVEGPDPRRYAWANAAFAMAANVVKSFSLYGWCARINGIESGGIVQDLPMLHFDTADGRVDTRSCTEITLNERREAELSRLGLIPLLHRKNTDQAAFISANSLQKPLEYADPSATANAILSSRLPHLLACCRFAHYLKCMVRDKVGSAKSREQLQGWLHGWLQRYVDGSPNTSSDEWKATHPLADAEITLDEKPDDPGQYEAKFFLTPHYQLEGLSVALRLVSRLPVG
jgi:type VI secretion system protein ImpC